MSKDPIGLGGLNAYNYGKNP
ncbi:hypothetical protein [Paraburkholderia caribensis]